MVEQRVKPFESRQVSQPMIVVVTRENVMTRAMMSMHRQKYSSCSHQLDISCFNRHAEDAKGRHMVIGSVIQGWL